MALSYFTESEAPRDFRISSTESEGHYTKCLLCYTVKKNFYCPDCIRAGNFVHSSMPYADRFSEKQGKLLRLKANRKHILDRCEKLMAGKLKKDSLITEAKQSRDKLDLLRLAIEQRRNGLDEKRKQLTELTQLNNELRLKLPRYQKRVSHLASHAADQRLQLHTRHNACADRNAALAALRRERVRQLNKYIFPVYISLDTSDSIEDMEFLGGEPEEEPPTRTQLHIVSPWLCADGDHSHVITWAKQNKEASMTAEPADNPLHRTVAALGLAAQLVALLAWTLDARLPHSLTLRVEAWTSESLVDMAAWEQWEALDVRDEPDPPEHLHWPEQEETEVCGRSPPSAPAPSPSASASLVTSAAGALASMWRGWTK
ncbi:beclin 1-associated autophagy-related key regulator isoform X2 [Cydia strobilella]|uniref:beclin 1-associated autophagy-related key regulator isoform X2 n=1 Tax=Cydia strobilella TaxID=1100964 RepID=UPI00300443D2